MKKVTIINKINGREFGAKFEDDQKMQEWIDSCIAKNSWGKPARVVWKDECLEAELLRVISEEEVIISMPEDVEQVTRTQVSLPVDYVITIIDITADYKLQTLRADRDNLLEKTDKFMLSDFPISAEVKQQYVNYRAYLRDLPQSEVLPEKPLSFDEFTAQ